MTSFRTLRRTGRGWIGAATAAAVMVAGAAVGAQASSAAPTPPRDEPNLATGTSPATDPHQAAAQRELVRMLAAFQPPPGATRDAHQPKPLPAGLAQPPFTAAALDQEKAVAWYSTSDAPSQVLLWVRDHPPTGSSESGSGSGSSGPSFLTFSFGTSDDELTITPETGPDGRTIVRVDATAIWRPSRNPDTLLGYTASSVSVVTTNPINPQIPLPPVEAKTLTSTDPRVIHAVIDQLNALQPPIRGIWNCAMDDGVRVRITLPGLATVVAAANGCGGVTITPPGGSTQSYSGGPGLIAKVYALFGITWSRTGDLPPGTERTEASGLR